MRPGERLFCEESQINDGPVQGISPAGMLFLVLLIATTLVTRRAARSGTSVPSTSLGRPLKLLIVFCCSAIAVFILSSH